MNPGKLRVAKAGYKICVYPNSDTDFRAADYIEPDEVFVFLKFVLSRTDMRTRYSLVLTARGIVGLSFEDQIRNRTVEVSSEGHSG